MTMRRFKTIASSISTIAVCTALMLAACSDNKVPDNGSDAANGEIALPQPEATGGSVTGMPDKPGPHPAGPLSGALAAPLPPDAAVAVDGGVVMPPANADTSGAGLSPDPETAETAAAGLPPPGEPTPQDAVAMVHDYYAAISGHDYAHAWALWSDSGRASGQSPQQFADGFADTIRVAVHVDPPGRVEGAAGSRYIEIPVAIDATQRDGSVRKYSGAYTLRRAMADGTTADQRTWRIASARLREVQP